MAETEQAHLENADVVHTGEGDTEILPPGKYCLLFQDKNGTSEYGWQQKERGRCNSDDEIHSPLNKTDMIHHSNINESDKEKTKTRSEDVLKNCDSRTRSQKDARQKVKKSLGSIAPGETWSLCCPCSAMQDVYKTTEGSERDKDEPGKRGPLLDNNETNTNVSNDPQDMTLDIFSSPFPTLAKKCGFQAITSKALSLPNKSLLCKVVENTNMDKIKSEYSGMDHDSLTGLAQENKKEENKAKSIQEEQIYSVFSPSIKVMKRFKNIANTNHGQILRDQDSSNQNKMANTKKMSKGPNQIKGLLHGSVSEEIISKPYKNMADAYSSIGICCQGNENGKSIKVTRSQPHKQQNIHKSAFKPMRHADGFNKSKERETEDLMAKAPIFQLGGESQKQPDTENSRNASLYGGKSCPTNHQMKEKFEESQTTSVSEVSSDISQATSAESFSDWTMDIQKQKDELHLFGKKPKVERKLMKSCPRIHDGCTDITVDVCKRYTHANNSKEVQNVRRIACENNNKKASDTPVHLYIQNIMKNSQLNPISTFASSAISLQMQAKSEDATLTAPSIGNDTESDDKEERQGIHDGSSSRSCSTQTVLSIDSPVFSFLTTLTNRSPFSCGVQNHHSSNVFDQHGMCRDNMNVNNADAGCGTSFVGHYLFELWKNQCLCDIRIRVGNSSYLAHTIVLAAFSDHFCDDPQALPTKVFDVHNTTPEAVHQILLYLYTSEMEITEKTLEHVLNAADEMGISEIVKLCEQILDNPTKENLDLYMDIRTRRGMRGSLTGFPKIYRNNFTEMLNSRHFLDLDVEQLEELLRDTEIKVESEADVIEAIAAWVEYHPLERTEQASYLLNNVKFDCMCPDELAEVVDKKKYIFDYEATSILMDAFKDLALRYGNDICKDQKAGMAQAMAEGFDPAQGVKRFSLYYDGTNTATVKEVNEENKERRSEAGSRQKPELKFQKPLHETTQYNTQNRNSKQVKDRRASEKSAKPTPRASAISDKSRPSNVGSRKSSRAASRSNTPSEGNGVSNPRKSAAEAMADKTSIQASVQLNRPSIVGRVSMNMTDDNFSAVKNEQTEGNSGNRFFLNPEIRDEDLTEDEAGEKRFSLKEGIIIDVQDHRPTALTSQNNVVKSCSSANEDRVANASDNHLNRSSSSRKSLDTEKPNDTKDQGQMEYFADNSIPSGRRSNTKSERIASRISELLSRSGQDSPPENTSNNLYQHQIEEPSVADEPDEYWQDSTCQPRRILHKVNSHSTKNATKKNRGLRPRSMSPHGADTARNAHVRV